jgi:hypothetical protein
VRPFRTTWRFLQRRTAVFWVPAALLAVTVVMSGEALHEDSKGERVAHRLTAFEPVAVDTVYWYVEEGTVEGVSVVVPTGESTTATVDLTGVEGYDEVDAYDGWQPAVPRAGASHYQPGMRVRLDLRSPAAGMAERDRGRYLDPATVRTDRVVLVLSALALTLLLGVTIRHDLRYVPPNRGSYRRRRRHRGSSRRRRRRRR